MSTLTLDDVTLPTRAGRWDVHCADGVIARIRPHDPGAGDGLHGALLTPAYVDVHHHLDKAFSATTYINRSGTLDEAIALSGRLKRESTEADVYARALRAARMALRNGTVRIRTHVDVDPVVGLTNVRALLRVREALPALEIQIVAFPQEGLGDYGQHVDLLHEAMILGCDLVGGIPSRDSDPHRHVKAVFDIAAAFDAPLDLHVDESDSPEARALDLVAEETSHRGWAGRVSASHCCSLAALEPEPRAEAIDAVAAAGVHVVTLPSTNLHLQGRGDRVRVRRGLAPVTELLSAGVNVTYGSDNIRDPFNPFGSADMGELGWLLAHAAHMGGTDGLTEIHRMATSRADAVLAGNRFPTADLLTEGAPADLLVLDAPTPADVIAQQIKPRRVIAGGVVVVERHEHIQFPSMGNHEGDVDV